MSRVLDTANGTAIPAFSLCRAAGNQDRDGKQHETLAGAVAFGSAIGKVSYKGVDYGSFDLIKGLKSDLFLGETSILLVNGTFSTIYLAEDVTAVKGGDQNCYPTFNHKTHAIPPAMPHPSKPGMFYIGCGIFSYRLNVWGDVAGAIKFGFHENGSNANFAISFSQSGSSGTEFMTIDSNATANLDTFNGSAKAFYDATVGAGNSQNWLASDSRNGVKIEASCNGGFPCVIARVFNDYPDYTVQDGDTLANIAKTFYRDSSVYPHIMRANSKLITNPDVIGTGWKLKMPDLI